MLVVYQCHCFSCYAPRRDRHSFPTRRSSDLGAAAPGQLDLEIEAEPPLVGGAEDDRVLAAPAVRVAVADLEGLAAVVRSEEHTSELQSLRHLVCRLLLEKKKKRKAYRHRSGA